MLTATGVSSNADDDILSGNGDKRGNSATACQSLVVSIISFQVASAVVQRWRYAASKHRAHLCEGVLLLLSRGREWDSVASRWHVDKDACESTPLTEGAEWSERSAKSRRHGQ